MKKLFLLLLLSTRLHAQQDPLQYPSSFKDTVTDNYFGTRVADPYRWLEDDTLQAAKKWRKEEASLADKYLTHASNRYMLDRQLKINGFYNFGTLTKSGRYFFDFLRSSGSELASVYIKKNMKGDEGRKIIDPADFAENKNDKAIISGISVSDDNEYLAFSVSHSGSDWREIRVQHIYPFRMQDDVIKDVKFSSIGWSGQGFFYTRYPHGSEDRLKEKNINPAIFYHHLGEAQEKDQLVYQDKENPEDDLYFNVIDSGKYFVVYNRVTTDEAALNKILVAKIDNGRPEALDTLILSRQNASFELIGVYDDKFLVQTTLDAPRGRLLLFDKHKRNEAETFIDQATQVLHETIIAGDKLVCTYLDNIDYKAAIYDTSGALVNVTEFPVGCSVSSITGSPGDSIAMYYLYSFLYPNIAFTLNVNSFANTLVKKTTVSYNYDAFEMEKVFYKSKDGQQIPMIIAHKKGLKKNGKTPTILYGYGGYGIVTTPFFNKGFISHLQNGGIVAIPALRGGGEMGADWHRKGAMFNKQNVFDDFIYAADFLVSEGYTSHDQLAIMGGSNGGLLVAAVVNQRPDICKVVIAKKGVYDMLRYHKFTIGHASKSEFGSSEDSAQFRYLLGYSPLHNVKDAAYPSILILTADHDDRAVPLHSYKYAAALQQKNKGNNPILLMVEKNEGHTSTDTDTEALIYSFIYNEMGISPKWVKTE